MKATLLSVLALLLPAAGASVAGTADSHPAGPEHSAASASASSQPASASAPISFTRKFRRSDQSFLITTEDEILLPENGMVMGCPAHAHGSPEQALAKLKDILRTVSADQLTSIWVCRADETNTLRRFAPLVDQVVLNPFTQIEQAGPDAKSPIWAGCDHPVLNFVRLLRAQSDRRMVACISTAGETSCFKKRPPSLEEIEWMIGAVVGANYQGIAWRYRGQLSEEFSGALAKRIRELSRYAPDLGKALVCSWAAGDGKAPVSTLRSGLKLFVVVLNPHYMTPRADGVVPLPVEHRRAQGSIRLQLPPGVSATDAKTISGLPVPIKDGAFAYSFAQGCEMYVVQTAGSPTTGDAK